ncbi:MAG: protein-tyrosine-phosphatase [Polyangiaceae bacterium]
MFHHLCIAALVTLVALSAAGCASGGAGAPPSAPAVAAPPPPAATMVNLLPAVAVSLASYEAGVDSIAADRKEMLDRIANYIRTKRAAGETTRLTFICTHNSRRSQMGQIWAAAAAGYYGIDHVETFSGGLEVTAFNPRAIAAVERAGVQIASSGGDNPHVKVTYASDRAPLEMFSKKYGDPFNPQKDFAAVMTCSHADESCPLVVGASARIPLHYEDPKASDGTPDETATYDARSKQIATEMLYVFSRLKADHEGLVSRL